MRVQIESDRAVLDWAVADAELARARVELHPFLGSRAPADLTALRVSTAPAGLVPDGPMPALSFLF